MHPSINQDIAKLYLDALYREADQNRLGALAKANARPSISLSDRLVRFVIGAPTARRTTAPEHV
jgi:hypothetical protein